MRNHLSLGELIAAIPTVLDATPTNAVVALSINARGLPTCALVVPRAALLDRPEGGAIAAAVADELAQERATVAVLVSYAEDDVRDGCAALDVLRLEMEYRVPHVEALAVQCGHWFRPGCREPGCCPGDGRPLPDVPSWLPAVLAEARGRYQARLRAAAPDHTRAAVRASAAASWHDALAAGEVHDAATARALAASLDDLCVRDWVVLTLLGAEREAADDALDGFDSAAVAEALDAALSGKVAREPAAAERARTVVERVASAARGRRRRASTNTLAAVLDWWDGNLAAACVRCDRALDADPAYRLAELVKVAASRGIGPGWASRMPI